MEHDTTRQHGNEEPVSVRRKNQKKDYLTPASILLASVILAAAWVYTTKLKVQPPATAQVAPNQTAVAIDEATILPPEGVILPVQWGDLGAQLVKSGVIDQKKFAAIYAQRGGLNPDDQALLAGTDNGALKITPANSGLLLNLLWALGLANKNDILEKGPMSDPQFGGAGGFAFTRGWTLAQGDAMNHFSRHRLLALTTDQQDLVKRVAANIYRPCCNNPTHFPDCNHGMAMLGLLELAATQGVSEEAMYKMALQVNAFWFPDAYLSIAKYAAQQGVAWTAANPKELLGASFSSGSGYKQILSQVTPVQSSGGGGCGV